MPKKNPHAVALGRMTSTAKAAASRRNGKLGGRPKKTAQTNQTTNPKDTK